ncbi:hypothetical protein B0T22DRAFT_451891 [Podospora appendiculata]|uniref:Uncharacterized protein n=1 Tax=Podospora appendiculata TaxID=314037 RepID=A0AAE0XIS5_9PEZI|nr:hypothetical protein B0T22DRAFT_451891 [Podospora appendiculata]
MKVHTTFLLLVSAAASVMGAALNITAVETTFAVAEAKAIAKANAQMERVQIGRIRCNVPDQKKNIPADVYNLSKTTITRLRDPRSICDIRRDHKGCRRVSCNDKSGVYLCADMAPIALTLPCFDVATVVNAIIDACTTGNMVKGIAYEANDRFSVMVHWDEDNC